MKGFKGAVAHNLEGIEFDVWLSKDKVPMILHGGSDGQLELYGLHDERVFDWTSDKLKTLDIGEGEVMPTLEELLHLVKGTRMLINIELKGPLTDEIKSLYDYDLAC
jgi:glycerophosphoryl diester phosphodiesterase